MRRLARVIAVMGLALFGTVPAWSLGADDIVVTIPESDDDARIENAQFRWGLNLESGGGAYAGGCNFLSAGRAGDAGSSRVWQAGENHLYRVQEGSVRIEKPVAGGDWVPASWENKCLDPWGTPVSTASTSSSSGNQVVIDGGTGVRRDGALEIRWTGSFTVVYYGGMTYWSVTDPVLTLDASGNGRVVATASGYGSSMDDVTKWTTIGEQSIVLAELRGARTSAASGFSVIPEYLGVSVTGAGQVGRTTDNVAHWGAFPQSFVDFQRATGQQGYWVSTNGARDAAKPTTPLYISYDASAPVDVPAPAAGAGGAGQAAAAPSNPLRIAPAVAPVVAAAPTAVAAFAASTPLTTTLQRSGLVPGIVGAMSPLVPPLLGSAAALSVAIVAVLSMMQLLPWQRVGR
jgi:hypothetical protein